MNDGSKSIANRTSKSVEQYNCIFVVEDFIKAKRCVADSRTLIILENACGYSLGCNDKRCGSRKSMFQHKFLPKDKVVTSVTHRVYECVYIHMGPYIPIVIHLMSYT